MRFSIKTAGMVLACFLLLFAVVTIMFIQTRSRMHKDAVAKLEDSAAYISSGIDDMVLNIYGVSDNFALSDRLWELINEDYSGRPTEKKRVTMRIVNSLFASYDILRSNEKIAAIYTNKGQLFNFTDPNMQEQPVIDELRQMDIDGKDKLARFYWYPVGANFLTDKRTEEIRKDYVVYGSRRVFSSLLSSYTFVQIFAVQEEKFYSKYSDVANSYGADIYILTGDGTLLSSSSEAAIAAGKADSGLVDTVLKRKYDRFDYDGNRVVFVSRSEINDLLTVISVPAENVTGMVDRFYGMIFLGILCCAILSCVALFWTYDRFMEPIARINTAMQRVYKGDLDAYISGYPNNEIGKMIEYYNAMLDSINTNVKDKLEMERMKRDLELEVLMNQINPHFLYNTLETIVWESNEAGAPQIGRMAAALGRLYRLSVAGGAQFITIRQELEHVSAYVKIQSQRYGDKLEFFMDADNAQLKDLYMIKLMLQPLVENSIVYGMQDGAISLQVKVSVSVMKDRVRIKVVDNGAGMSKQRLEAVRRQIMTGERAEDPGRQTRKKSTGIGMHNVYERLKLNFGIENGVKIYSKEGKGTLTILTLPIILRDEAEKRNNQSKK